MGADELKWLFPQEKAHLAESLLRHINPEFALRARPAIASGFQAGTRGRTRSGA